VQTYVRPVGAAGSVREVLQNRLRSEAVMAGW
jgi:hypothetical protein